jgi:hypothetical protein
MTIDNSISQEMIDKIRNYFKNVLEKSGLGHYSLEDENASLNSLLSNMLNRLYNLDNQLNVLKGIQKKYQDDKKIIFEEMRNDYEKLYSQKHSDEFAVKRLKNLSLYEISLLMQDIEE